MDQPVQSSGLTARLQSLFDKQSICNNSIGLLSGIPRPAWMIQFTRKMPDNQPIVETTTGVDNPTENNSQTTFVQIIKSSATVNTRTPFPWPPTASGLPDSASHNDANATAHSLKDVTVPACDLTAVVQTRPLPARPRSISEVQADIRSRIADIDAARPSRTETETSAMPEFLANMQLVPQNTNAPTGPLKGITEPARDTSKENKAELRTKQTIAEKQADKNSEWVKSTYVGNFPNPYFKDLGDVGRNKTRIFPIQICKTELNAIFGRRLVLFTDGSECDRIGVSGSAVVYRRFYDMESTEAESSHPNAWEEEANGTIGEPKRPMSETVALATALGVVQREVKEFFAKPPCEAGGKLEPLRVYVFVDSRDAIINLQRISTNQVNNKHMNDFHILQLTKAWRGVQPLLKNAKVRLEIHWLKGHNGVEGNLLADKLAAQARLVTIEFKKACASPGNGCEVFSLKDMEHELMSAKSATERPEPSLQQSSSGTKELKKGEKEAKQKDVAQQDALGQIQMLFAEFFNETRENSEKLNRLAFDELRKELFKKPKESLQQEAIKSQRHNRLAFDELRIEISRMFRQQEAQSAQAESMMIALEEARDEWRENLAVQSREIKALRKEGEELLRTLREETREAVKTVVQAVASSAKQTGDESEGEGRADDTSSISASSSDNQGTMPVEGPDVVAEVAQPDDEVVSRASSGSSMEMVKTAFKVAVNSVEDNEIEAEGHVGIEEEDQEDIASSTSRESAEVPDLVTEPESPDETVKSCAGSGETVFGETKAQSAGSDVREENAGKSPGKLRRRERLLRKLHLRWPGRKS